MTTLHDFSALHLDGHEASMADYAGRTVLVVNTASECGYTPQYQGLQELYEHFGAEKLAILAFPCNQFGGQEPGSADEIAQFCEARFAVRFDLFDKIEVNGPNAHPLWRWLTGADSAKPQPIKWNFTKFLLDSKGRLVKRFEPAVAPYELLDDIAILVSRASG